ncbi:MAG: hypothetical protein AAGF83_26375, partial [Cyanobacteria bacterium P01_G01_bin.67]
CLFIYYAFTPHYTKEECKQIKSNLNQLRIGMTKIEVISLIRKESKDKVYPYSGLFPEHKTQWEILMLCVDSDSCIYVKTLEREQCREWHMIAFDAQTGKVVKIFSDDPERIGFI